MRQFGRDELRMADLLFNLGIKESYGIKKAAQGCSIGISGMVSASNLYFRFKN